MCVFVLCPPPPCTLGCRCQCRATIYLVVLPTNSTSSTYYYLLPSCTEAAKLTTPPPLKTLSCCQPKSVTPFHKENIIVLPPPPPLLAFRPAPAPARRPPPPPPRRTGGARENSSRGLVRGIPHARELSRLHLTENCLFLVRRAARTSAPRRATLSGGLSGGRGCPLTPGKSGLAANQSRVHPFWGSIKVHNNEVVLAQFKSLVV